MEETNEIRIFEFNDIKGEFQELDIAEGVLLFELLDSDSILLYIDHMHRRVWHWIGSFTTIRSRFIAGYTAHTIRDKYAFAFRVTHIDEGNEPIAFKVMVGLEEETEYIEEEIEPQYMGTEEDDQIFEDLSKEKILLILKKAELPEGYERKMVIINGDIYYYRESGENFGESTVKIERLFSLQEQVDDGPYLMEGFTPRLLFSYNKIVLIELLQKKK